MKHPGHTYGGFVSAISERGMIEKLGPKSGFGALIRGKVSSILYSNPIMDDLPVRPNPKQVPLQNTLGRS
jgi:hypothetical protein